MYHIESVVLKTIIKAVVTQTTSELRADIFVFQIFNCYNAKATNETHFFL